jgi:RNA polymerase sigma-54 factor
MGLGPRLDLRQSQQLVMTPQLQQAIKLLALSNIELEAVISTELEKNPLLEVVDMDSIPEPQERDQPQNDEAFDLTAETPADQMLGLDSGQADHNLDVDLSESVFHHDSVADSVGSGPTEAAQNGGLDGALSLNGPSQGSGGEISGEDVAGFESRLVAPDSLHDHLTAQAGLTFKTLMERMIATHLIDLIDEGGYLTGTIEDVAARLEIPSAHVLDVLLKIQTFDPVGVGARSLSECLALQAKEVDRYDPAMAALINNLELLARGDLPSLKRACRVDHEDLADMIGELRSYNPKPGLVFGGERTQTVVPDIFVRKNTTGAWAVELNTATLPRVLINRTYYTELSTKCGGKEDKQFLSDYLANANWLIKALDQRARTILKVTTELVRQQEDFFEQGVRYLKPLTLRTIAEAISMHESTVSRVTSNKFISCSRGMFELKYFFTSGIQASDGGMASAESVKARIKQLIDAERTDAVLSDDQLVDALRANNFDVARRTVAKYREALRIPSSVQRRRLKTVGARA